MEHLYVGTITFEQQIVQPLVTPDGVVIHQVNPTIVRNLYVATCCTNAKSVEEAQKIMVDKLEAKYPATDGWVRTWTRFDQVDDDLVIAIANQLPKP